MDEMITPQPVTREDAAIQQDMARRHKRKIVTTAVIIIAAIALVAGLVFWYIKKQQQRVLTPTETLEMLSDSSAPVTTTPSERAGTLNALTSHSVARPDEQNVFNKLK